MQININYMKDSDIKSLQIGDLLSDKSFKGKVIEIKPKESTGWGITYAFVVENEYGNCKTISREI